MKTDAGGDAKLLSSESFLAQTQALEKLKWFCFCLNRLKQPKWKSSHKLKSYKKNNWKVPAFHQPFACFSKL